MYLLYYSDGQVIRIAAASYQKMLCLYPQSSVVVVVVVLLHVLEAVFPARHVAGELGPRVKVVIKERRNRSRRGCARTRRTGS